MQLLTINKSLEIAFDSFGSKNNPLVLLISGAGAPAEFWPEVFCENLALKGRYVLRYSHRDTGNSTHFDESYSIEELLQDMLEFLTLITNHRNVHLVGHSMGGYLAQMAMCRLPEDIVSVTSISAGSTVTPEVASELGMSSVSEATWQMLMKNQPAGNFEKDLPGWLESWRFLNGSREIDIQSAIRYTRALYTGDPRNAQVAVNHIHAMSTVPSSLAREITKVDCRFLVIHGTEDPLVPLDHGVASSRLVPNGKIVQLEGAGHMFFNEETWSEISQSLVAHTNGRT
jgi:pimeloyl-ACP methyl ester carboxylesterase